MLSSQDISNASSQRQQYLLDHLAEHLRLAHQHARLRSLFANDEWMRLRVMSSKYIYSGFVEDIAIARAALSEAETDGDGERVSSLSDYVRLGLIESSVSSLSTMPINLVVNAVATGCWPLARALAVVARNPSIVERVVIYTGLLMCEKLDTAERNQIQQLVLAAVFDARSGIPVRFLVRLLPFLQGETFEEIWKEIMRQFSSAPLKPTTPGWLNIQFTEEDQEVYIDEAISLLENAPANRRGPIVGRVAEAIFDCIKSSRRDPDKSTEAERAPDTLLAAVLNSATSSLLRDGQDPKTLGRQLQRIAPYIPESDSAKSLLLQLVEVLETIEAAEFYQLVLPAFASMLSDDLLARVLKRTLAFPPGPEPIELLTSLSPQLDRKLLAYAREQLNAFENESQRDAAINALAQDVEEGTPSAQENRRDQHSSVEELNGLEAFAQALAESITLPSKKKQMNSSRSQNAISCRLSQTTTGLQSLGISSSALRILCSRAVS